MKPNTYITSDIHFYHDNILKFCSQTRPYANVDEMNERIVKNWNDLISPIDTVYILGDIAFANAEKSARIMNRCHGRKILIEGNHDIKLLRNPIFRNCFDEIHTYLEIGHSDHRLVLFHYPIWEWDNMYRGSIHFHGHCHGRPTGIDGRIMDVSMDRNDCTPYLLDDVVLQMARLPVRNR